MDTLGKTLFPSEVGLGGKAPPLDGVEPLPCDRWLAASALQKAIRRGDALTAGRAVRTLYRYDPRWPGADCWSSLTRTSASALSTRWSQPQCAARTRKPGREAGRDEASALATSQMLAAAPSHVILNARRQQMRLVNLPGPKVLAHGHAKNQTRRTLASDYSDRLLDTETPGRRRAIQTLFRTTARTRPQREDR